jgi:holo-[acyl-carrier protein] synthase
MIGIDVVDVARFRALLRRQPAFAKRFFTAEERAYCERFPDPPLRLAGTFAAKEAAAKSLGGASPAACARRVHVVRSDDGAPHARFDGRRVALSISHDGDVAVAVAVALFERGDDSGTARGDPVARGRGDAGTQPMEQETPVPFKPQYPLGTLCRYCWW